MLLVVLRCRRPVRNTGVVPLVMLCVQYLAGTPGCVAGIADGDLAAGEVTW